MAVHIAADRQAEEMQDRRRNVGINAPVKGFPLPDARPAHADHAEMPMLHRRDRRPRGECRPAGGRRCGNRGQLQNNHGSLSAGKLDKAAEHGVLVAIGRADDVLVKHEESSGTQSSLGG